MLACVLWLVCSHQTRVNYSHNIRTRVCGVRGDLMDAAASPTGRLVQSQKLSHLQAQSCRMTDFLCKHTFYQQKVTGVTWISSAKNEMLQNHSVRLDSVNVWSTNLPESCGIKLDLFIETNRLIIVTVIVALNIQHLCICTLWKQFFLPWEDLGCLLLALWSCVFSFCLVWQHCIL